MTTFHSEQELIAAGMAESLELDPPLDQDLSNEVAVIREPSRTHEQAA